MKKKKTILVLVMFLVCLVAHSARAELILFENFEDSSGFIAYGNAHYWGVAPLSGTGLVPSNFIQGGSQSGNIFYGVNGWDSSATMTISLPNLTGYTDLYLTVALAAPEGVWESSHRDSLYISGTTGLIDSFLPPARPSSLRSQIHSSNLLLGFQDFEYAIDSSLNSLTFTFASTADDEVIGIDSVRITGTPIPEPCTLLLLGLGGLLIRKQ